MRSRVSDDVQTAATSTGKLQEVSDRGEGGGGSRIVRILDATERHRRPLVVGVILVVIALVAVLLLRSGSEPKSSTSSGAEAVIDNFNRNDSDINLGVSDTGEKWKAQSGVWGIQGHAARLVRADGRKAGIVTVDLGAPDGLVRATESVVGNGAGVVFRYRDANNYWSVQAAPSFATWVVVKVIDGKSKQVSNLGLSATHNGPSVSVQLQGDRIEVFINGVLLKTLRDAALKNATQAGLIAGGPSGPSARFSAFVGAPPGTSPPTSTSVQPTQSAPPSTTTTVARPITTARTATTARK
jgi:hypothetical protein